MIQIQDGTSVSQQILHLLGQGKKKDQIITMLLQEGQDEYFVKQLVEETAKLQYAKLRSQGLALILAGGVVCFLSCLLTLTSTFSSSTFPMVLYGFTTIGILLVFAGLVKIF